MVPPTPGGVKVNRVEIRKIEPPENLVRAMNMQMTAERERRAQVARAEGEREAEVRRAEGQKASQILEAEGRLKRPSAMRRRASAWQKAEARATRLVAEAPPARARAALRYFIADKYVKAFEALAANPSAKLVVVPMEASSLAAGITQAMELLRAGSPPPGPPATR